MSDYDDEIDDDDTGDGEDSSKLVRDLRKQLKDAKKREADFGEKLQQFEAAQRRSSVADLLKKVGADPDYAEFYTGDDSSPEAVNSWIQSKAKLLGINEDADGPDEETVDAVSSIARSASNAPATKVGSMNDHIQRLNAAKTPAEYAAALKAAGLAAAE